MTLSNHEKLSCMELALNRVMIEDPEHRKEWEEVRNLPADSLAMLYDALKNEDKHR